MRLTTNKQLSNNTNKRLKIAKFPICLIAVIFAICYLPVNAQSPTSNLLISPDQQTVLANSVFETTIFLDTNGNNINTIELNIKFPPDKLAIIKPSGDKSLISAWLEPPTYSNTNGTVRLVGVITNGINIKNGLIATITFKARNSGQAIVSIEPSSKVLANDGLGTEAIVGFGRASYTITPVPPEGVKVFSETHPFQNIWYSNKNPTLAWEAQKDITDFSYELDNKPLTNPDNIPDTKEVVKNYENLSDGIWYFHIKSLRSGTWGRTTHFAIRIDSTPPAPFKPKVEFLTAEIIARAIVSFTTTDAFSGLDHYEVGVIDKTKSPSLSPVFVLAESPYQLSNFVSGALRVVVRAFDKAGNVRDESININLPFLSIFPFLQNNLLAVLVGSAIIFLIGLIAHYFLGHHLLAKSRQIWDIIRELFRVMEK